MPLAAILLALALGAPPASGYLGEFRVTYYYLAVEDERFLGLASDEPLLDVRGDRIALVSAAFRRELDREGSGRLGDGRLINVVVKQDGRWRYQVLDAASWGLGSTGRPLVPFVTLAADPELLPPGSRVLVPALEPGRCFEVTDSGSAIRGARLDVFIGERRLLASAESRVASHQATAVFEAVEECCPGAQP